MIIFFFRKNGSDQWNQKRNGMTIKDTEKKFSDCLDDNTPGQEETLYYITLLHYVTTLNCHNL